LSEDRHSHAEVAQLLSDPIEIARREAENGLRQFNLAIQIIATHVKDSERPFKLRHGPILQLHKAALDGLHPLAGTFRNTSVKIQGSVHQPPEAAFVGDWLGTGVTATRARQYRRFDEARAFVHTLALKRKSDWRSYCRSGDKPHDIPARPDHVYAEEGWVGWGDWLERQAEGQHRCVRTCAVPGCGNTFTAVRSTARYCSDKCRLTAARLRRRKGLTVLPLELPTTAVEGIIAALEHNGLSEAEASDLRRIAAELTRHVVHLLRCTGPDLLY
jgi:hypothetical protein